MIKLMQSFPELWNNYLTNGVELLRQLILLEDFKNCISSDIRAHIDEQNAPTFDAAARMADEYALTHEVNFSIKSKQHFQRVMRTINQ